MFSNKDLRNLIFPLFIEQFLLMFVGIADTFVVSFSSEADVSGVSLVTSFNTVMIFLFTALSAGGAVIISQYIGCDDKKMASRAAGQLLTISCLISATLTILILCFRKPLLRLLFGQIEPDVMAACESYLFITTLSLPALAVYDAGAALCRSIGKTNVTMYISLVTNFYPSASTRNPMSYTIFWSGHGIFSSYFLEETGDFSSIKPSCGIASGINSRHINVFRHHCDTQFVEMPGIS